MPCGPPTKPKLAGVETQPVISARGEARLEVDPEIAVVSVTIEARHADRAWRPRPAVSAP
jgi:hypothetical protein